MKIEVNTDNVDALKDAALEFSSRETVTESLSKNAQETLNKLGISVDAVTAKAIESKAKSLKASDLSKSAASIVHIDL
ncbi:hypothetical protein GCM10011344_11730 [Dokdonia pacifica]|uniref:Uncharacterized protein n=1 Tax=Dokdonia pacifica TaxID=1627892 RepID=A0A238YG14_9FLAO|nr:hypothetical protein [Dokdonia pacifica]GGG12653.1 hypothetical protein GCM10011344_11730 [Dokdonia pacifica]SNR69738.1 hypothetical protein SAMN06265376_10220 [Dokdonia pacifica]